MVSVHQFLFQTQKPACMCPSLTRCQIKSMGTGMSHFHTSLINLWLFRRWQMLTVPAKHLAVSEILTDCKFACFFSLVAICGLCDFIEN